MQNTNARVWIRQLSYAGFRTRSQHIGQDHIPTDPTQLLQYETFDDNVNVRICMILPITLVERNWEISRESQMHTAAALQVQGEHSSILFLFYRATFWIRLDLRFCVYTRPTTPEYDIRGDSGSANREPRTSNREPVADNSWGKCWSPLLQYYGPRTTKTTELQW